MRKLWMIVAGVAVGLPLLGAAVLMLVDVNQFRPRIQGLLEQKLHRTVSLGAMSLKLYPLAIRIEDVAIGESPKFASRSPFLSAKVFDVRIDLGAFLRKQVEIDALHVSKPDVELIRNKAGKWNFGEFTAAPSTGGGSAVSLESLTISDAKITVTDLRHGGGKAAYDHIDLTANNFSPGKPFTAELKVPLGSNAKAGLGLQLSGIAGSTDVDGKLKFDAVPLAALTQFLGSAKGSLPALILTGGAEFSSHGDDLLLKSAKLESGGVKITGSGEAKGDNAHFEFQANGAQLAGLLQMGRIESLSGTGTVTLKLKVSGPIKALTYAGTASLRDASLKFPSLRSPLLIQAADVRISPDQMTLVIAQARIGSSHAKGALNVRDFARPKLDFSLDVDKIDTLELENLFFPASGGQPGAKSATGPHVSGSGKVSIGKLTANQFVLTDIQAACSLDGTTIMLDPLTAKLYGGTQTGSIVLSTNGEKPAYALKSGLESVDAGQLLNSMSSLKNALTGTLSSDSDLRILPAQDLAHGLNGTVQLKLLNGKLANVQVMNELSAIGKFLGYAKKEGNFTNIAKLAGTLHIVNGIATTDDLAMEIDGGTVNAVGAFGLTDQSLKLKLTAVLSKDASQRAGGGQVGGWLSTVLSNPKGELVIPAIVSGTFSNPHFAPDAERMAKMKLEGLKQQLPINDILNIFRKPKQQ